MQRSKGTRTIKPRGCLSKNGPLPSRKLGTALALLAAALLLVAASANAAQSVSDRDVTLAIEVELALDEAVDANRIDISTQKGIVMLSGSVGNMLAKERAASIAQCIVGVRGVVNRIEVKTIIRKDPELAKAVERALFLDPATDSYEVGATAKNGAVTLSGTVQSWQEKQLCADVAKSVRGVTEVNNEIMIQYKIVRPDGEIRPEIEARLQNDILIDDALVSVAVKNGNVELAGIVGSSAEKIRAQLDARVNGVKSVNAETLEVKWWARDEMRRTTLYESIDDAKIKKAVRDAMLYDPRVLSFKTNIEVLNGIVTLSGVVNNLKAKKSAAQNARNTIGVWRVKNHMRVRPTIVPSNDELEKMVSEAFDNDPYIDRYDISISAYNGTVYLSGTVMNSFEENRAEQVAEGVKGVVHIYNNLDFKYAWTWKPDWVVLEDVKEQLFWSPFVDADQVSVVVDNGVVTLNGKVDTLSEKQDAEHNAYQGGAKEVRNNLKVKINIGGSYPQGYYYQFQYPFFKPFVNSYPPFYR